MSLIKLLTCDKGGLLLASETPAIAQSVSDSMKWNTRSEVAVQILSNFVLGIIVGAGVVDKAEGDLDLGSPFIAIGTYWETDMIHYNDWDPEQSAFAGMVGQGMNYGMGYAHRIPGLPVLNIDIFGVKNPLMKSLGTEVGSASDIATTVAVTLGGYLADKGEQYLQSSNSVLEEQELENGKLKDATMNNLVSEKKIISKEY